MRYMVPLRVFLFSMYAYNEAILFIFGPVLLFWASWLLSISGYVSLEAEAPSNGERPKQHVDEEWASSVAALTSCVLLLPPLLSNISVFAVKGPVYFVVWTQVSLLATLLSILAYISYLFFFVDTIKELGPLDLLLDFTEEQRMEKDRIIRSARHRKFERRVLIKLAFILLRISAVLFIASSLPLFEVAVNLK